MGGCVPPEASGNGILLNQASGAPAFIHVRLVRLPSRRFDPSSLTANNAGIEARRPVVPTSSQSASGWPSFSSMTAPSVERPPPLPQMVTSDLPAGISPTPSKARTTESFRLLRKCGSCEQRFAPAANDRNVRTPDIRSSKMLQAARMAGLVMSQRGIGHTDERQVRAELDAAPAKLPSMLRDA